jgi:hypothetical protein
VLLFAYSSRLRLDVFLQIREFKKKKARTHTNTRKKIIRKLQLFEKINRLKSISDLTEMFLIFSLQAREIA